MDHNEDATCDALCRQQCCLTCQTDMKELSGVHTSTINAHEVVMGMCWQACTMCSVLATAPP
jgi:hypothetical protein